MNTKFLLIRIGKMLHTSHGLPILMTFKLLPLCVNDHFMNLKMLQYKCIYHWQVCCEKRMFRKRIKCWKLSYAFVICVLNLFGVIGHKTYNVCHDRETLLKYWCVMGRLNEKPKRGVAILQTRDIQNKYFVCQMND